MQHLCEKSATFSHQAAFGSTLQYKALEFWSKTEEHDRQSALVPPFSKLLSLMFYLCVFIHVDVSKYYALYMFYIYLLLCISCFPFCLSFGRSLKENPAGYSQDMLIAIYVFWLSKYSALFADSVWSFPLSFSQASRMSFYFFVFSTWLGIAYSILFQFQTTVCLKLSCYFLFFQPPLWSLLIRLPVLKIETMQLYFEVVSFRVCSTRLKKAW